MSKETILAVIAGLSLGVLAAWGVWNFSQKKPADLSTSVLLKTQSPDSLAKTNGFELTLKQPENDSLQNSPTATVSGKTVKGATVVISTSLDDQVLTASPDGSFKTEVDLREGKNDITITAFDKSGEEKTETRTVNYTNKEF